MDTPKVLVAAPTYSGKDYAMERWLDNVASFTYPNFRVLLVDNSQGNGFYQRYSSQVRMLKLVNPDPHLAMKRVTMSMEIIRQKFLSEKYDYWFNLEIDVLPKDQEVIQKLLHFSVDLNIDLVNHAYPGRYNSNLEHQGIGCSIISRKLASMINFNEAGDVSPDGWLWGKIRKRNEIKMIDLWNLFPILHISK